MDAERTKISWIVECNLEELIVERDSEATTLMELLSKTVITWLGPQCLPIDIDLCFIRFLLANWSWEEIKSHPSIAEGSSFSTAWTQFASIWLIHFELESSCQGRSPIYLLLPLRTSPTHAHIKSFNMKSLNSGLMRSNLLNLDSSNHSSNQLFALSLLGIKNLVLFFLLFPWWPHDSR